jgi:hypothetical protein
MTKSKAKSMVIQSANTKCIIYKEIYSSQQWSLQSSYEVSAVMHSSERLRITTIIYTVFPCLAQMLVCVHKVRNWELGWWPIIRRALVTISFFQQNMSSYLLSDLQHHTDTQFKNTIKHTEKDLYPNIWCQH